jgi:ABC-type phosphate/phosphonate transport system substrate-binding protein
MRTIVDFGAWLVAASLLLSPALSFAEEADSPLTVVVMDPLAGPLACDCVQGYAQRKYEVLGEYLEASLGRPVRLVWSSSLPKALKEEAEGRADLIIGKHSVVRSDAKLAKLDLTQIALLTSRDGSTTQTGLIVVPKDDPAKTVADLKGYRVLFGPEDCDEKHAAPVSLLKDAGVETSKTPETAAACSEAATKVLELPDEVRAAAVISSYAQPLLEGCGTISKGDLRIVGETKPVPFVAAFINNRLSRSEREMITEVLLATGEDPLLCLALESQSGFVEPETARSPKAVTTASKKKN